MRFSRDQMIGRVNKPSQPTKPHKSATIAAVSVMRKAAKNRRSRLSHAVLNLNTACSSISLSSSGTSLTAYSNRLVNSNGIIARNSSNAILVSADGEPYFKRDRNS